MLDIHPQHLTLSQLLDGRLFQIPDYQRAYSWTSHERKDLFEDIERVYSKGIKASHFMAAVVCLRKKKIRIGTDEFYKMDVVDGQQRLTTLIILLNVINLELNKAKSDEGKLARELGELLIKDDGARLLLLQTNHDSSDHFATFLREGTATPSDTASTIADRELLGAIEECQEFVVDWKDAGRKLTALATLLKNRLSFLIHEITSEGSVYTVFEVLNSRGLEVSWLDRLKSILMGAAFELKAADRRGLIDELHSTWRDIYSVIGLRQGMSTEALRFAATLWLDDAPSRPVGEQGSVDIFRPHTQSAKQILAVAKWVLSVTKARDKVTANPRLSAVTRISQARLLATAIHLNKKFKTNERIELLDAWEKVSFRIYGMMNLDARNLVGDFVKLAWRVAQQSPTAKITKAEIIAIGSRYPMEDVINVLRGRNCYKDWENELRYFMFRYEEYLSEQQGLNFKNEQWLKIWIESPSRSIEHILAQSKSPKNVKHSLGNLVLLPPSLNSKLQAMTPKSKSDAYRKTGLLIAEEVASAIQKSGWSGKSIIKRETKLLEWAAKEWSD